MKKFFKSLILVIFLMFSFYTTILAKSNNDFAKRIVSVVYDDSWSMFANKQDYAYANYALQNIIGVMNENDELHVVKMSNKTQYETINLTSKDKKTSQILDVSSWKKGADETPFEAVETAVNCLKERKSIYGSGDNVEYWLLVLTDGVFEGMPADVKGYFDNVASYMSDVKFESIFVFIGKHSYSNLKTIVTEMPNSTCIDSENNEDICRALFKASEKIYGRTSFKGSNIEVDNDEVSFDYPFPIRKMIIYEQDQDVDMHIVNSTSNSKNKEYKFYNDDYVSYQTKKTNAPVLQSKIIELNLDNDFINSGHIVLKFDNKINASENKLRIMVDPAISFDLMAVDNTDKEIKDFSFFTVEDIASFVAIPKNPYNNEVIDMSDFLNKTIANYIYDDKTTRLEYDKNKLYFKFFSSLKVGSNAFFANLELINYFKVKSNMVVIPISPEPIAIEPMISSNEIKIETCFEDEYKKVDSLNYQLKNIKDKVSGTLLFTNIPEGIQIRVNGEVVKENKVSLTLNENNMIDLYRNKDYKGDVSQNININVELDDKTVNIKDKGAQFAIIPFDRNVTLNIEKLYADESELNTSNVFDRDLFKIVPLVNGKNIDENELKESKIEFMDVPKDISFDYRFDKDKGAFFVSMKHSLISSIKPSFEDMSIDSIMTFTTPYNDVIKENIKLVIKNDIISTILGILKRIVLPICLIIVILGAIFKSRFDTKNYKFIIARNGKEEDPGVIYVNSLSKIFPPFAPEKAQVYDFYLKACRSKKQVIILKKSFKKYSNEGEYTLNYDGDDVDIKKDKQIYEDTPFEIIEKNGKSKNKTLYTYHDVRKDIEEEDTKRKSRRRRY